jgi:hypothetical protein
MHLVKPEVWRVEFVPEEFIESLAVQGEAIEGTGDILSQLVHGVWKFDMLGVGFFLEKWPHAVVFFVVQDSCLDQDREF